jgi:hypothetical protein
MILLRSPRPRAPRIKRRAVNVIKHDFPKPPKPRPPIPRRVPFLTADLRPITRAPMGSA